jgi:putative tricarboxylic transport membrane protein
LDLMLSVLASLFSVNNLLICALGTLFGAIFGAIPGLNSGIGVAILLPLTYTMPPTVGLLFLGGIYMGSSYGGSISAILINCPGTAESSCTGIDGNAMARKGRAKEALYYSVLASTIGGVVGVLALIFFTPTLAMVSVKFGPSEMFLVTACGLTIVGSLTGGKSIVKGIFATLFGLFLAMIGMDEASGTMRFTFGLQALVGGIDLIPAVIGFFALAEMVKQAAELRSANGSENKILFENTNAFTIFKKMIAGHWVNLTKSSLLGTIIGIIPGTGGAISSFLAYGEARRSAKNITGFGQGDPDGIIAPESANNAAVGGSLIPLLALGIPGSSTSAIMFGALTIHGLIPGQGLFTEHGVITYTFLYGMLFNVFFMLLIGVFGIPIFSKIIKIKMGYIIPAVIICSLIGAYSVRNSMLDVYIAIALAIVGVLFQKLGIAASPVILGLILGDLIESNFMRCLIIANAKKMNIIQYILSSPLSIVILLLTVFLIYTNVKAMRKEQKIKANIQSNLLVKGTEE